jgi:ribosomal protein L11 methyltransferase
MNYTEVIFVLNREDAAETLMAQLTECGFEGFEEEEGKVKAYIPSSKFTNEMLVHFDEQWCDGALSGWTVHTLMDQNWNALWESNFEPVRIDGICLIRAPFHEPDASLPMEVVVEPKMSFGTGHHQTTRLMVIAMSKLDLKGKCVLDMGCGTGILAIVAARWGALSGDAIDCDMWSVENSEENFKRNAVNQFRVFQGMAEDIPEGARYDVVLANINRNVLLEDIPTYSRCLSTKGILLMSGFYEEDANVIKEVCERNELSFVEGSHEDRWTCLQFIKN